jgi:hypothetical protein
MISDLLSSTLSKINSISAAWRMLAKAKSGDFLAGAVMRWMTQKWIVPREGETVWDVVLDATMALFSAAVATEVIQIVFSAL